MAPGGRIGLLVLHATKIPAWVAEPGVGAVDRRLSVAPAMPVSVRLPAGLLASAAVPLVEPLSRGAGLSVLQLQQWVDEGGVVTSGVPPARESRPRDAVSIPVPLA